MGTFFGDIIITKVEGPKSLTEKVDQEMSIYLPLDQVDPSVNVLSWWQIQATKLPMIANVVKQILCVPTTSTPSERAFSKAGNLITKKRAQLKPGKVDMVLFLNTNMKI